MPFFEGDEAAISALLRGKAALAAKPKFKTYPERFDYEKGFAKYYEKNIRPLADSFEKERVKEIKTARRRWFCSLPMLLFFFLAAAAYIVLRKINLQVISQFYAFCLYYVLFCISSLLPPSCVMKLA